MKNKALLPIILLATFALVGCNTAKKTSSEAQSSSQQSSETSSQQSSETSSQQSSETSSQQSSESSSEQSSESSSSSSEEIQYGVAITNKEAFAEDWYDGDSPRNLNIELTPAANVLKEIQAGNLVIESSDPEVATINGVAVAPVAEGTATITVTYHGESDSLDVDILHKLTIKEKYDVDHEGTEEDPLTPEEALAIAKNAKYAEGAEDLYISGEVDAWYHEPIEQHKDGTCFYYKPAQAGGERFEVYKMFDKDGKKLKDGDVWLGGTVLCHGKFTKYGNQYETSSAIFVSCTGGEKPEARKTVEKTFAEVMAINDALADGSNSYDYLKFEGYVTKKEGNNYFLTATKGEALVTAKSDKDHGEKDYYSNGFELYSASAEGLSAKLLEGAKVEVTTIVKNYHGQAENLLTLANDDITVKEAGEAWKVPEPAVAEKTLAEFLAVENNKKKAYKVTATIKAFNSGETKNEYGNMTLTDGENDLPLYGSSATATALAWDNSDSYAFTNPKDFLTNEVTSALKVGDVVVMKLIRSDYTKDGVTTKQGQGIILEVNPKAPAETTPLALNAENLLGYDGTANVPYSADYADATIDGVEFTYQQIGAYKSGFAGMQFRNKLSDNNIKAKSNLNNKTATATAIQSIDFVWHSSKDIKTNSNVLKVTFGTENTFTTGTEVVMVNTEQGVKSFSIAPTNKTFTFVKIEIDDGFTYTCYFESITLNLAK